MVSKEGQMAEDEDFNKGNLGKEFAKATLLSISEAYYTLDQEQRKPNFKLNEIFRKTFEYLSRFNKYSSKAVVKSVRGMLDGYRLEEFEATALWNLCPESVAAAKELIPSLKEKFESDEKLAELIEKLQNDRTLA